MRAEIISVGTELLLGNITDTNATFLAQQLALLGIDLYHVSQVGDNLGRAKEVLRQAWSRSDLVVTTGGLGPTQDDLTREAIAAMLGEELSIDPELERGLREWFARRGRPMPETNVKQANLIRSARPLPNPLGSAPGWWIQRDGKMLAAMPGVPAEMYRMWQEEVMPRLRPHLSGGVIYSLTLKTTGIGESALEELLTPFISSTNPTLATYAKQDGVHLRLTAKAPNEDEARLMLQHLETKVQPIIADYLWGWDNDTLEGVVGNLLKERGLTLATLESCTGGLLASTITDIPGSSAYFIGGLVAYTNEMKVAFGVDARVIEAYGAISLQSAKAMAIAARTTLRADIGLAITGVAGPQEQEGQPVGTTFIGITDGSRQGVYPGLYRPNRLNIKLNAVTAALAQLRLWLLDKA